MTRRPKAVEDTLAYQMAEVDKALRVLGEVLWDHTRELLKRMAAFNERMARMNDPSERNS